MIDIFDKSGIYYKAEEVEGSPVSVRLGTKSSPRPYLMVDTAGGNQPFRTQYDVAIDGSTYLLTAGKGVGEYSFLLLEGPITLCDGRTKDKSISFLEDFKKLKGAEARQLTIVVLPDRAKSTSGKAVFKGIIRNIQTSTTRAKTGEVYVYVKVEAVGQWNQ